jgi:CRISPR/Cas system-associated endonuclease Cas1
LIAVQPDDDLFGIVKNGVLTLGAGYGASIKVRRNQLVIRDVGIDLTYARALCPLSRIVVVRSEGYVTFPAVRWLDDIGAVLMQLDHTGRPLLLSIPPRPAGTARLRRLQAGLSIAAGLGAEIARELIEAKIAGQIELLRHLDRIEPAMRAGEFAAMLPSVTGAEGILGIEGRVSLI